MTRSRVHHLAPLCAALLACTGFSAQVAPTGRLGVLPDGYWQCGLPGDALGVAFRVDDRISFSTVPNSSYRARDGRGTYLLTGETVVFTRGPLKGLRMMWESADRLRADAAHESGGRLLCNRRAHRDVNPG